MRIYVRSGKLRLFFWLPLAMIKGRLASKIIAEATKSNYSKEKADDAIEENEELAVDIGEQDETKNIQANAEVAAENVVEQTEKTLTDLQEATAEFVEETSENNEEAIEAKPAIDRDFLKKVYAALKTVVKKCGHFTMVDVISEDDEDGKTRVKITI